jgi:hypothetical protein
METTLALLRRQARLLNALLNHAEEAASGEDWLVAEQSLAALGERLQQRIQVAEGSVFPWIERRVGGPRFVPVARLTLQHASLVERLGQALALVAERDGDQAGPAIGRVRALLDAHLREEDEVLWPMVEPRH